MNRYKKSELYKDNWTEVMNHVTLGIGQRVGASTGFWYLWISNNLGNADLTHEHLDNPNELGQGLKKCGVNIYKEVKCAFLGLYKQPKNICHTQGRSTKHMAKGVAYGIGGLLTVLPNTLLKATNTFANTMKNMSEGINANPQRYRFPRYFDEEQRMIEYCSDKAHAATALRGCGKGGYRHYEKPELEYHLTEKTIEFAVDLTSVNPDKEYSQKIFFVTEKFMFFIRNQKDI